MTKAHHPETAQLSAWAVGAPVTGIGRDQLTASLTTEEAGPLSPTQKCFSGGPWVWHVWPL